MKKRERKTESMIIFLNFKVVIIQKYFFRYEKDMATMVRVVREFLKIPETVFTTQEILDVCGVLNVNAHELPVTPTPVQALYANISILEHSCINNASKHFDGDFRVVIRAAVNIKKGEHISINYSDPMWGTNSRQLHLGKHCESYFSYLMYVFSFFS